MDEAQLKQLAQQLSKPSGEAGLEVARLMHQGNISMTRAAISALSIKDQDHILEIGHGSCAHLVEIIQQAANIRYTGLEISETMHAEAIKINESLNASHHIHFMLYDGIQIPLSPESVNHALTVNTLYFWKHPQAFMNELFQVLKPGGSCAIAFANKSFMEKLPFTAYGFEIYETNEVEHLALESGFSIKELKGFNEPVQSKTGELVDREFSVLVLQKEKTDPM